MKIALITDMLTNDVLSVKNDFIGKQMTSLNYKIVLKLWKPDFLFVESAWEGHRNKWTFKIVVYPDYLISLNVNTIEDSEAMFSRRPVEIISCGSTTVTNPTSEVERYFKEYCCTVTNEEEALELFERLKDGSSKVDLARAEAGVQNVAREHTWRHHLEEISSVIGLEK